MLWSQSVLYMKYTQTDPLSLPSLKFTRSLIFTVQLYRNGSKMLLIDNCLLNIRHIINLRLGGERGYSYPHFADRTHCVFSSPATRASLASSLLQSELSSWLETGDETTLCDHSQTHGLRWVGHLGFELKWWVHTYNNQPLSHRIPTNQNQKWHMSCTYMNNIQDRRPFTYTAEKFGLPVFGQVVLRVSEALASSRCN